MPSSPRWAEWQQKSWRSPDWRFGQHRLRPGDCSVAATRPRRMDWRHVWDAHHHRHGLRHRWRPRYRRSVPQWEQVSLYQLAFKYWLPYSGTNKTASHHDNSPIKVLYNPFWLGAVKRHQTLTCISLLHKHWFVTSLRERRFKIISWFVFKY